MKEWYEVSYYDIETKKDWAEIIDITNSLYLVKFKRVCKDGVVRFERRWFSLDKDGGLYYIQRKGKDIRDIWDFHFTKMQKETLEKRYRENGGHYADS